MSPNPKVGSAFCTFSYNLKSIAEFRNASMAPSPPTTPHPLFPVQQVNSSSSSTSSSSSWSRSLPPPTSCSAALRLQCPQSLSTWIKTSPHFHFSTRVVSTYLFIFTFFHSSMGKGYNNLSLSLFNWSQDISKIFISLSLFNLSYDISSFSLSLFSTRPELRQLFINMSQDISSFPLFPFNLS